MKKLRILYLNLWAITLMSGLVISKNCYYATNKQLSPRLEVCFTPGCQAMQWIEKVISKAKNTILVQAYVFTSANIAKALVEAHTRNIQVKIIADRSQLTIKGSKIGYLLQHGIPVWVDTVPGIAHNKVMIIDEEYVLTGSFNWTNAAYKCNAENLLLIQDQKITQSYKANWEQRLIGATPINLAYIKQAKTKQ
jgi:phospholipase D